MTQLDLYSADQLQSGSSPIGRVFNYAGTNIRALVLSDEPWFVAADVCSVLEIRNNRDALAGLDDDEKGVGITDTLGGPQKMAIVNEPGLYSLIFRSRKAEAKSFKRWITHEVLPALRKVGKYAIAPTVDDRIPQTLPEALRHYADSLDTIEQQKTAIAELEPRAAQADHQRKAEGAATIATFCTDMQLWARENHGVKLLHDEIRAFLGDIKLVIRSGPRRNEPYAEAVKAGLVRESKGSFGTNTHGDIETISARLTPKGWGHAWDRAVARIADHGSLERSKAVATT